VLGIALAIGLVPYATGLVGIPVLYVLCAPVQDWLAARTGRRAAAGCVVALALFLLVVVGGSFAGLIISEAQRLAEGIVQSRILARLSDLKVGGVNVGARLADLGGQIVSWIGSSALGFVGTASRLALNIAISLVGLFYLLLRPEETWDAVQPYIPFSARNAEELAQRFRDVTKSTVIGTGLSAAIQGVFVGLGFWVAGFPDAALWGVVTTVVSVLPVLGSALVWGPGVITLLLDHRTGAALLLALWGVVFVGNVVHVIQPMVSRRWANIHPLVTLIGALLGVPYFGILGLLIGPLAISYFFELINMYREEYVT
jgi:predicted PurR-regulated permease PerM